MKSLLQLNFDKETFQTLTRVKSVAAGFILMLYVRMYNAIYEVFDSRV